jgi:hypothetical protein
VRLEPLYRASWTTPEAYSVEIAGETGTEGRSFFLAEGRTEGRLSGRLRAANFPRRRVDGALTPDFRGVLETDDGATVLFSWRGLARPSGSGMRELVGSITHETGDDRYAWLNDRVCALGGEVVPDGDGGFHVEIEVAEILWEPVSAELRGDARDARLRGADKGAGHG